MGTESICACGHPTFGHDDGRGECYASGCKCRAPRQSTDIEQLVATATSMREQLGEDYPKRGSILDLWFRTADALEREHQRAASAEAAIRDALAWMDAGHGRLNGHPLRRILHTALDTEKGDAS